MSEVVSQVTIESKIRLIRGKKVMLDRDLAELYDVATKVLNQTVKRNSERFPEDFISTHKRRGGNLKVTICDLQTGVQYKISALCLCGIWRGHAFKLPKF
jgi:hypothetical protein